MFFELDLGQNIINMDNTNVLVPLEEYRPPYYLLNFCMVLFMCCKHIDNVKMTIVNVCVHGE